MDVGTIVIQRTLIKEDSHRMAYITRLNKHTHQHTRKIHTLTNAQPCQRNHKHIHAHTTYTKKGIHAVDTYMEKHTQTTMVKGPTHPFLIRICSPDVPLRRDGAKTRHISPLGITADVASDMMAYS